MQANLGLAPNTIDAYGRALDDYIRFSTAASVDVATAGREHVARWVRDLCERPNAAAAGARQSGLSNATIQQRLTAVRLFYDHLVFEAVRDQNPVRAHTAATRVGRATTAETSSERSQGKSHRRVVSIWRSRCVKTRALVPRQARVWLGMLLTTHNRQSRAHRPTPDDHDAGHHHTVTVAAQARRTASGKKRHVATQKRHPSVIGVSQSCFRRDLRGTCRSQTRQNGRPKRMPQSG